MGTSAVDESSKYDKKTREEIRDEFCHLDSLIVELFFGRAKDP